MPLLLCSVRVVRATAVVGMPPSSGQRRLVYQTRLVYLAVLAGGRRGATVIFWSLELPRLRSHWPWETTARVADFFFVSGGWRDGEYL